MSHNTLLEKIEADVKEAIAEIEAKQASAVSVIERETEAKIDSLKSAHKAQLDKTLAHKELVAVSRAKQAANIAVQQAKRDCINTIIADVQAEIAKLPSNEYVEFYSAQLKSAVGEETVDVVQVISAAGRTEEAEKILKTIHAKADIIEDTSVSGGIILHTKHGVYDITLNRLIAEKRALMEMDIVRALTS